MSEQVGLLEILNQTAGKLARAQDLETALNLIMDELGERLGCSHAGIWAADERTRTLELRVTRAAGAGFPVMRRLTYGVGVVGAVARTHVPIVVVERDWPDPDDPFARAGFYAAVVVPLIWQGELYGVLAVLDEKPSPRRTADDLRLVELLGQQAAPTLAHDRLRHYLADKQERLASLHGATRTILENPDKSTNLVEVVEALRAMGWGQIILGLCGEGLQVEHLITAGVPEDEREMYTDSVLPDGVWQRFMAGELENYRLNGLYYIVSDEGGGLHWQPADLLFAPLRVGKNQIAGVIRFEQPVDNLRPTAESLQLLDILASQAAYVIEHDRLLDETTRTAQQLAEQVDEMSMIHRADRELSAHLDMDRIMTLTMDWALRRTGADTGLLALMTLDRDGIVPFVNMGYLEEEVKYTEQNPLPLDDGLIGMAVRAGQIRTVRSPQADERVVGPGARAQIAVPLAMRGEVLGVIILASRLLDAFDENDIKFLERLARRAAVALDNARLYRQAEQLADDLAVLYSASRTITSTLEREEVLQRIAQSMAVSLECSSAMILDYQPETRQAHVLVSYRVGTVRDTQEALPPVKSNVALVAYPSVVAAIEQHRLLSLRRASLPDSDPLRDYMVKNGLYALVLAPLVAQGEVIGLALMVEGRHDRVFGPNETYRIEALAGQASVALRQTLLYSEVLELEKIKSEMIRMASHDLRNPLNNILGYADLIALALRQDERPGVLEDYLASLRRSAKTMQSLIEDLLTLERVESERESQWQVFDLGALIYEVVETERSSAALKHQSLLYRSDASLPTTFGSVMQVRQAVTNLIGNAIKYTPENGHIEVRLYYSQERLNFEVQDDGYGISPDRQARIFERFYRAREPGTDHVPGTGLGLSLVRTVIERHGGQVWFTSAPGEGSTFGFWLPVAS